MVDKLEAGEIIRADRQAAWKYRPACYWLGDDTMERWMNGAYDAAAPVIADFARHRIAATPTEDTRERVKALEEALEAIRDGDVPRPVHCHWRADGKPSKLDECKHGVTMSEDCAGCTAEFIDTALGNKETDRHG